LGEEAGRTFSGAAAARPPHSIARRRRAGEVVVHVAVTGHRRTDVTGIDALAGVDPPRHPAGLEELIYDLGLGRRELVLLVHRVAVAEHPPGQLVELRQRLGGRVGHEGLEPLPLRLPLVPVELGIAHAGSKPQRPGRETPTPPLHSPP
jgi:hypothetical protein